MVLFPFLRCEKNCRLCRKKYVQFRGFALLLNVSGQVINHISPFQQTLKVVLNYLTDC